MAGGFLATYGLLKVAKPDLVPAQIEQLLWLGMFFGFAPDLDYFLSFVKEKAWIIRDTGSNSHRKFPTHAPAFWMAAGLIIYFFAQSTFVKFVGLTMWLASWSHFLIDTVESGIMWLWPFRRKRFALIKADDYRPSDMNFFGYWWGFVKLYIRSASFYLEIAIILSALAVVYSLL